MTKAVSAALVTREFWRLMATNDFHAVAAVLAPDFVLEWPAIQGTQVEELLDEAGVGENDG